MARLKSRHKRLAVKRLAMYDRPSEVRDTLQRRFGVDATLSQIVHYDPTTERGASLAEDLVELFWETREAFEEEQEGIAVAQKAKRLRELEKQFYRLDDLIEDLPDRNVMHRADLMAEQREVLEQIARETGGMYTRRRLLELTGKDGGPIETEEQGGGVQVFFPKEADEEDLQWRPNGDDE